MTIRVHVKANSKTDSTVVEQDGTIHIKIRAAPVAGQANKYLVKYLSCVFEIPVSKIAITKGHNNPHKAIRLDVDENHVHSILESLIKK